MGQELLVREQIDAAEELARDFSEIVPVDALFWLKLADHDDWTLFLATAKYGPGTLIDGYKEIQRLFAERQYRWLDKLKVKLIYSTDPLSTEVMRIRDHYPLPRARDFDGTSIAGTPIDAAYLYPPTATPSPAH